MTDMHGHENVIDHKWLQIYVLWKKEHTFLRKYWEGEIHLVFHFMEKLSKQKSITKYTVNWVEKINENFIYIAILLELTTLVNYRVFPFLPIKSFPIS